MHADDLADAIVFILKNYSDPEHINVGSGEDIPIKELAYAIKDVVGFTGELVFDVSKPDGTPRKLMDGKKLNSMGWTPKIDLQSGLNSAYRSFLSEIAGTTNN
jgi:GDP-L-fucose synthase